MGALDTLTLDALGNVGLIDDHAAAGLAGISRSLWWKLYASGKTPAAIKLGAATRWNLSELIAWINAGCPSRDTWEKRSRAATGGGTS